MSQDPGDPQLEIDVMEDVISNLAKFKTYELSDNSNRVTPCVNHPQKRIQYICKTE